MSSSQGYRQQAPKPVATGEYMMGTDEDYDYNVGSDVKSFLKQSGPPPPPPQGRPPSKSPSSRRTPPKPEISGERVNAENPLLDLEQLEELHQEAERMKALGNKHMAALEYTRAYNAYSAALKLSPVGPSSHVFLCNRAAALLSLKRYAAAATDARRAIALAPAFGKSHARLGQSLYFLKDYEGAAAAYEEAVKYEPDNTVTRTYLEKARSKLTRQHERARRQARGEDMSIAEESTIFTVANSVATDPHGNAAIVSAGARGDQKALVAAAGRMPREVSTGTSLVTSPLAEEGEQFDGEDDPDFDEAVRIQERANKMLTAKRYKEAIQEYSSALFLVPDDPFLSPELHLGRAHALNGTQRHESARNDSLLAIKINPSSEAYATLAKSLFYMKDYLGAIAAYEDCMDLLPQGESLSMFDQAYLRKAEAAWQEELVANPDEAQSLASTPAKSRAIPKLPPPRFVPREKAISSTPNMPPMPKRWPQQSPRSPTGLKVGPERSVMFLSESLGIKLNRGADGIVRVLSVSPETPSSPIARSGTILAGDVVREAAGVDIRRPITNIMWGDTIALIKIAPRPITLVVATELSEIPDAVEEERTRAMAEEAMSPAKRSASRGEAKEEDEDGDGDEEEGEDEERIVIMPSCANGDESVQESIAMANEHAARIPTDTIRPGHEVTDSAVASPDFSEDVVVDSSNGKFDSLDRAGGVEEQKSSDSVDEHPELASSSGSATSPDDDRVEVEPIQGEENDKVAPSMDEGEGRPEGAISEGTIDVNCTDKDESAVEEARKTRNASAIFEDLQDSREDEITMLGGEILFERKCDELGLNDWSNLRWLATSGQRQLRYCKEVTRTQRARKNLFRSGHQKQLRRKLAIYENPDLILVLRPPKNADEVNTLLDLPDGVKIVKDGHDALSAFWVAESVIDPITCKLRLSQLTTVTSIGSVADEKGTPAPGSCIELIAPTETIFLSALSAEQQRDVLGGRSLMGGPAFLEMASLERAIADSMYHAHSPHVDFQGKADSAWKHQVVQGTLHSFVLSGNNALLEKAIKAAIDAEEPNGDSDEKTKYVRPEIIDCLDESGRTPLHYACLRKGSQAVSLLTKAGASCEIPLNPGGFFPCHLSSLVHDEKSLSIILSATHPTRPNPNALDSLGRTPMYLAAVDGHNSADIEMDADSLSRCLSALEAWGGQIMYESPIVHRHPVSVLASRWQPREIAAVLAHAAFRYPLEPVGRPSVQVGISTGASFQYPIHSALLGLRKKVQMVGEGDDSHGLLIGERVLPEYPIVGTLRVLLEHGFEANERLEAITDDFEGAAELAEYIGYAPLQILAAAALGAHALSDTVGTALKVSVFQMIAGAAELLVQCGGRLSLDPPPESRSTRSVSSVTAGALSKSPAEDEFISAKVDRESLKIDGHKALLKLLGGQERLKEAKDYWVQLKSVEATDRLTRLKEASASSFDDSDAPGGSDEKSCAVCWREFGTLMNRRHKCQATLRYVCDDCSSKRVSDGQVEHRVSDGQFCLARVDAARDSVDAAAQLKLKLQLGRENVRATREASSSDEDNRNSLFSGIMETMSNLVLGEEDATRETSDQINSLAGKLNQTKDMLDERGEKLNSLQEKTTQLVDSSHEFAKMAKELERSQRGFW